MVRRFSQTSQNSKTPLAQQYFKGLFKSVKGTLHSDTATFTKPKRTTAIWCEAVANEQNVITIFDS
jgi:hypothetical protein